MHTLKMFFGRPSTLPGQFCEKNIYLQPTITFEQNLIQKVNNLVFTLWRTKKKTSTHQKIFTTVNTFSYETIQFKKKKLCPTYSGRFQEVERHAKYFTLIIKGKQDTISIDRLKPSYIDLTIKKIRRNILQPQKIPNCPTIFHAVTYTYKHHHKVL